MPSKNVDYRAASKVNWSVAVETDKPFSNCTPFPGREVVMIGSLQRIADATELMAHNYLQLQADRDRYKKWWLEERAARDAADLRGAGLKGVITKLRKQLNDLQDGAHDTRAAGSAAEETRPAVR